MLFRDAIRFCFMNLIRKDLKIVQLEWNTHVMRKNIHKVTEKPEFMWACPHAYGNYTRHLYPINERTIEHLHETFAEDDNPNGVTEDVENHFCYIMDKYNLKQPDTIDSALSLYRNLIDKVSYTQE